MAQDPRALPAQLVIRPQDLGLPEAAVSDVRAANEALAKALSRPGVRLVGPLTLLSVIPPGHAIALQAVRFDEAHWYAVDGGKWALSARAIELLASAAGLETERSVRVDDGSKPYACAFTVSVLYTRMDGRKLRIERSASVDYSTVDTEDSKAALGNNNNAKMLSRARQFATRSCETKAFARCVRAALGLIGQNAEAKGATFVVPTLVPHLDMSDPEIKRMVAAKTLGIVRDVFGPGAGEPVRLRAVDDIEELAETPDEDPGAAMRVGGGNGTSPIDVTPQPKALPAPPPVEEDPTSWREQVERESAAQAAARATKPASAGRPAAHPDDDPRPRRPAFACTRCGAEIGERLASYTDQTFGVFLCREHVPAEGGAR